MSDTPDDKCTDCKGTGRYEGLQFEGGPCLTCDGTGRVGGPAPAASHAPGDLSTKHTHGLAEEINELRCQIAELRDRLAQLSNVVSEVADAAGLSESFSTVTEGIAQALDQLASEAPSPSPPPRERFGPRRFKAKYTRTLPGEIRKVDEPVGVGEAFRAALPDEVRKHVAEYEPDFAVGDVVVVRGLGKCVIDKIRTGLSGELEYQVHPLYRPMEYAYTTAGVMTWL